MRLIEVPPGMEARVTSIHVPEAPRLRLGEMGLRQGALVRVIQKVGAGGRLLGMGVSRLAIDRATARSVEVEVLR